MDIPRLLAETELKKVAWFEEVDSTNDRALQLAIQPELPTPYLIGADRQVSGRGRGTNRWWGSDGSLMFSVVVDMTSFGLMPVDWPRFSLVTGLAISTMLSSFLPGSAVGLKWPNDVLTGQGKLAGVLIEAQGDMYGPSSVVIGIGINCTLPLNVARIIDQPATALDQVCVDPPTRNKLLGVLLQELAAVLDVFSLNGFSGLRAEWLQYHAQQNLAVQLTMPDGAVIAGVAVGVSDRGELCLKTDSGLSHYNSGELGGLRD